MTSPTQTPIEIVLKATKAKSQFDMVHLRPIEIVNMIENYHSQFTPPSDDINGKAKSKYFVCKPLTTEQQINELRHEISNLKDRLDYAEKRLGIYPS